jgi:hypothetical protein
VSTCSSSHRWNLNNTEQAKRGGRWRHPAAHLSAARRSRPLLLVGASLPTVLYCSKLVAKRQEMCRQDVVDRKPEEVNAEGCAEGRSVALMKAQSDGNAGGRSEWSNHGQWAVVIKKMEAALRRYDHHVMQSRARHVEVRTRRSDPSKRMRLSTITLYPQTISNLSMRCRPHMRALGTSTSHPCRCCFAPVSSEQVRSHVRPVHWRVIS